MDPNIFLEIYPLTTEGRLAFSHNNNRYTIPNNDLDHSNFNYDSRESTPSVVGEPQCEPCIQLRFDWKPKRPELGFVFGSNPRLCDVVIGERKHRISGTHFAITVDADERVIVTDLGSKHGVAISYNGHCRTEKRKDFTWILFDHVTQHKVIVSESHEFELRLVRSEDRAEFRNLVRIYLEEKFAATPSLNLLHVQDEACTAGTTRPQSPDQPPIYIVSGHLGDGAFSKVLLGYNVSTGYAYAVKIFLKKDSKREAREVQLLKNCSHPHIVQFVDFQAESEVNLRNGLPGPCLIMEYLPFGDMETQSSHQSFLTGEILLIMDQTLQALSYLHSKGIAHRDIKPTNILFESRSPTVVKIGDFGIASKESLETVCGTAMYAAPELRTVRHLSTALDIWSLGIICLEYVYGLRYPEDEASTATTTRNRCDTKKIVFPLGESWYDTIFQSVNDEDADDLLLLLRNSMLVELPENRQTADQCREQLHSLDLFESLVKPHGPCESTSFATHYAPSPTFSTLLQAKTNQDETTTHAEVSQTKDNTTAIWASTSGHADLNTVSLPIPQARTQRRQLTRAAKSLIHDPA